MGKNWLCRWGMRIVVLLGCSIMGGLWDSTARAQEFYLSFQGNPSVSPTFGTPVEDSFNTGRCRPSAPDQVQQPLSQPRAPVTTAEV
jgi:hypothetical protein